MHLLVDVDGVIADQVSSVLRKLNFERGLNITRTQIKAWDQAIADKDIKTEIELALQDPGFVLEMEIIEGATEALNTLSDNHTMTIATNRASEITLPTKQWLDKHEIPYDRYICTENLGKENLNGDLLIDDYPGNIISFSSTGRAAILFDQPWNADDETMNSRISEKKVCRCHDWAQIVSLIELIEIG